MESNRKMKKIGVLGGTFDPFHYGHLSIAKSALEEFELDEIFLMPAHVQPFKVGKSITDPVHRVNMVKLIAQEYAGFNTITKEAFTEEISYTYRTLCNLREELGECRIYFVLGTDSFLNIESWYKAPDLLRDFSIIVGERPGYRETEVLDLKNKLKEKYGADIGILNNHILQISSTEIKENIRQGKSIDHMVPASIERYIREHGLYN